MKKQILILSLMTLGYIASSHGAGVFVMAQVNKIKESMLQGTTQKINAQAADIKSQNPTNAGTDVLELSEKKPGKWTITALNPGTAVIELKKDKAGHKVKKHHCKHTITVTPKKTTTKKVKSEVQKIKQDFKNFETEVKEVEEKVEKRMRRTNS